MSVGAEDVQPDTSNAILAVLVHQPLEDCLRVSRERRKRTGRLTQILGVLNKADEVGRDRILLTALPRRDPRPGHIRTVGLVEFEVAGVQPSHRHSNLAYALRWLCSGATRSAIRTSLKGDRLKQ